MSSQDQINFAVKNFPGLVKWCETLESDLRAVKSKMADLEKRLTQQENAGNVNDKSSDAAESKPKTRSKKADAETDSK